MKIVFMMISCLALVSANSIATNEETEILRRIEFSEAARVELKQAALLAVEFLCVKEQVMPEIMNTVCARAMRSSYGQRSAGDVSIGSYACTDCGIADPICYSACPQFLI